MLEHNLWSLTAGAKTVVQLLLKNLVIPGWNHFEVDFLDLDVRQLIQLRTALFVFVDSHAVRTVVGAGSSEGGKQAFGAEDLVDLLETLANHGLDIGVLLAVGLHDLVALSLVLRIYSVSFVLGNHWRLLVLVMSNLLMHRQIRLEICRLVGWQDRFCVALGAR